MTKLILPTDSITYVASRGPANSTIVVVGEAPGAQEALEGIAFTGRSGLLVQATFKKHGIDWQRDVLFTNVVRVQPPRNRTPTKSEIESWTPLLKEELTKYFRDTIICMGRVAKEALVSANQWPWSSDHCPQIYFLNHPAYVLRFRSHLPKWEGQMSAIIKNTKNYSEEHVKYYTPVQLPTLYLIKPKV